MTNSKQNNFSFSHNFFIFWFVSLPCYIWQIISLETLRLFKIFSISLLLKTLFEPWKRDWAPTSGLSLQDRVYVMAENLVSRLIGVFIRCCAILTGLVVGIAYFVVGVSFLIFLFFLPVLIFFSYHIIKKYHGI